MGLNIGTGSRVWRAGLIAAPIVLMAAAALAQTDPMAGYYGNTLAYKSGNTVSKIWYMPDGSYIQFNLNPPAAGAPAGATAVTAARGTFAIRNNQVCLKETRSGQESCRAGDLNKKVGDTWTATAGGAAQSFELTAGQ